MPLVKVPRPEWRRHSHIKTQYQKQDQKQSSHRRRATPTFTKVSFGQEIANMTDDTKASRMPLQILATNHGNSTFATIARTAELNASRLRRSNQDGRALDSSTTDEAGEGAAQSSYLVLRPWHSRKRSSKMRKATDGPLRASEEDSTIVADDAAQFLGAFFYGILFQLVFLSESPSGPTMFP